MKPLVTNVWSNVREGRSRVVVEATTPANARFTWISPLCLSLELEGVNLNFPPGSTQVHDGLIQEIEVVQGGPDRVRVLVALEEQAGVQLKHLEGMPHRTVLEFGRESIVAVLKGQVIGIDPGHGGRDCGARGPVNLMEKDVVLEIGGYLETILREEGASPLLTRTKDQTLSLAERKKRVALHRANLVLGLHTGSSPHRNKRGVRTLYHPASPGSRELARAVHEAVLEKLPVPDRGTAIDGQGTLGGQSRPGVVIELVTITNPLDEAWLRSLTFKWQAARALANGVLDYLRRRNP